MKGCWCKETLLFLDRVEYEAPNDGEGDAKMKYNNQRKEGDFATYKKIHQ